VQRFVFLVLLSGSCCAQTYLNLGFEGGSGLHPVSWAWNTSAFDIQEDSTVAYQGRQSLRIRNTVPSPFASRAAQLFPVADAAGKHVRFSGFIKTEGVAAKGPGIYWTVTSDSGRNSLSQDDTSKLAPAGTNDWTRFVIDRDVSSTATGITFGCLLNGVGTAWFDGLQVEIDGKPYPQGPDALGRPPTQAEQDWILRHSIPVTGLIPLPVSTGVGQGADLMAATPPSSRRAFADLPALKQLIGDAHVIGMGEGTHGTHEFFQMKHQMLEFLASEVGVTIFAMEANMPEAYRINDYVLTGRGDPRELLKGMHFWTWNTKEVLDMILWMRQYNASGRGPLQFTGFDLQYAEMAMDNVRTFVSSADPAYLSQLDPIYKQVEDAQNVNGSYGGYPLVQVQNAVAAAHQVVQYLDGNRAVYSKKFAAADIEWAVQNARVVEQATYGRTGDPNFRDSAMAVNAEWILRQSPPGSKIMLWAHNGHIMRKELAMGSYLAANHGHDYLPVGQILHDGQYNARVDDGKSLVPPVKLNDADPSEPGSIEYALHSMGIPRFILDLRIASSGDPASAWLLGGVQLRSIGAFAPGGFSVKWDLTQYFDVMIFFEHTHGSVLLPL
jgi:erythromycin esterase